VSSTDPEINGASPPAGNVALRLRNVSKTFGATRALRGLDIEFRRGEIHAVCGQNGSGKSTLIKILSAYQAPDSGDSECIIDGQSVKLPLRPGQPEQLGLRFVHQDLGLAPRMSVLDNFYVDGYPRSRAGTISWPVARRIAAETLRRFGLEVSLNDPVSALRPAERAIVAIARAMRPDARGTLTARVLILDEPTVHLPARDVSRMMEALRSVCAAGVAVVIVTHRIEEVMEFADRASVLRNGVLVGTSPVRDLDHDALVELLLGRALDNEYPETPEGSGSARRVLSLRSFGTGRADDVDLNLHEGEILGITGLVGSGFEDVPYGIFGAAPHVGSITLDDKPLSIRDPSAAIAHGFVLVPADRLGSCVPSASLLQNFTLPFLSQFTFGPFIRTSSESKATRNALEHYDVRPAGSAARPMSSLSGGNQQKLLLARWLERNPRVMLLHEPTQGVDIGSRRQLFGFITDAASDGCAIILASAQYADLAALCHRVLVFDRGRIVGEMTGGGLDEDRIASMCLSGPR
jgi:ribose transport system ATP-binding protein